MAVNHFNDRLRQLVFFGSIVLVAVLLLSQLRSFIPGILGGITLFILTRSLFYRWVFEKKWKKNLTAIFIIFICLLLVLGPLYFTIYLVTPTIHSIVDQQAAVVDSIQQLIKNIQHQTGVSLLTSNNTKVITEKMSGWALQVINSTASILANLLLMFFLLYYLLIHGKEMEQLLRRMIPLKPDNIQLLAYETKSMVKANALGIPLICLIQGIFAALGYWIFGIHDWLLWGLVTGVFAFFPLIGTMIIWVPLVGMVWASGQSWNALFLGLYSLLITGNVDYLARLTLMKRMGNIHPLVTVFGVIVGLHLFGFMGLIFGPLLVTYFIVLLKIYVIEFASHDRPEDPAHE
jgi:predicted PurR-regulated permease PerM